MPFPISRWRRLFVPARRLAPLLLLPALLAGLAVASSSLEDGASADTAFAEATSLDSLGYDAWQRSEIGRLQQELADLLVTYHPVRATLLGLHEGDAALGLSGPDGEHRTAKAWRAFAGSLAAAAPEAVTADDRLDLGMMLHEARRQIYLLETRPRSARDPGWAVRELSGGVYGLLIRDHAPLEERVAALASRLRGSAAFLEGAAQRVEAPPRRLVEHAIGECDALTDYLMDGLPQATADLSDESLLGELDAAVRLALEAVWRYRLFLEEEQLATAHLDPALGEEEFLARLRVAEGVSATAEELRAQCRGELARLQAELAEAAGAYDSALTAREAVRALAADHPPADSVQTILRGALAEVRSYFAGHPDLPPVETPEIRVAPSPTLTRGVLASLVTAGPYETAAFTPVVYVTLPIPGVPDGDREQQLRFFNRGQLLNLALHEGVPGHVLQGEVCRRLRRPARRLLQSAAFVEGWAHYAESLAPQVGFRANDAEFLLATRHSALRRAGRFRVALGLHTEGWTEEQAATFLEAECYLEPWVARREAARGIADPLYLGYTWGRLQIEALRREFVEEGDLTLRAFHARVLAAGAPTFPLLRARLSAGDPPPRGYLD